MIEIKNLDFYYKRNHQVLKDITMNFRAGRITGLLGKNGVGKSTLLHLIAGLQFPVEGTVNVMGYIPHKRQLNFLQNIFLLNEEVPETTLSIAKFEKVNAVFYPAFSHEDFVKYLAEFEITELKERIDKLSFGTRKKVFISFALAVNTKLLLMDEPTNGLDIPSKATLRKILRLRMNDERLIIISTHQARDLQNILDSVVILNNENLLLNAADSEITQKLYFGIATGNESPDTVLYREPSVAGDQIVRLNTANEESNLDVELLFNAAFQSKELFAKTFNIK